MNINAETTVQQYLAKEVLDKIDFAITECSGKTLVDASKVVDMLLDIRHHALFLASDDALATFAGALG